MFHFTIFVTVPKKNCSLFREQVKALFRITNLEQARALKNEILEQFSEEKGYQIASCTCLDEGFEDAFQYVIVGQAHTRIRSTNLLERLNQEVRRREKVVRIFPNTASATRLIGPC
ncbi:transposase [Streptococcus thermophilus]|uniref:transposase n=1 Tax=Streptococcus thermophilus TaxID=1308 RepID=UPI001C64F27B|nr:transposase [Streptococcus thermophilus]MBW7822267.1 transposase [Streptococcus thermophilus]